GTVGSQDWMKAALTARAAGLNPKSMRFVAFEGGGEALTALQGGHVQVYSGDASEAEEQIKAGAKIRLLAVMSDKRLEGSLSKVPTAKEQGFDIQWPIIRGFYLGPKVSDADYKVWVDTFNKMMATPAYNKLRAERGLFPFAMTGPELDQYVKGRVAFYRTLAAEFGLNVAK
ncbi:MAG: tripartite tricarboxylate transporter substrate-binding protein, partial [Betaproteobacteria bacterium]